MLSAKSANVVRRNMAMLPAYSFLLGMIALLGYLALAAGVKTNNTSEAVPLPFLRMFPEWFAGFCLSAIAIGALVPAAIMSISASNLFTRNIYGAFARKPLSPAGESQMAKLVSLVVKFGALVFVLRLPVAYAIDMQLLGGIWIAQLFPAVVVGTFSRWFHPWALLAGWAAGIGTGTGMVASLGLKSSVYPLHLFGETYAMYAAVPALLLNLLLSAILTVVLRKAKLGREMDMAATVPAE
jgi:SSS family solute:Na+ symporter